jgi:hypothetical protein
MNALGLSTLQTQGRLLICHLSSPSLITAVELAAVARLSHAPQLLLVQAKSREPPRVLEVREVDIAITSHGEKEWAYIHQDRLA